MENKIDKMPEITLKYKASSVKKIKLTNSYEVSEYLKNIREIYNDETINLYESYIVVFLNRALEAIGWIRISQGGMSGTVVDVRLIFSTALKCAASGLITSHNHPSGNNSPSESDIKTHKQIKDAATFLSIEIIDNLIITDDQYYSFAENGIL